MSEFISMTEQKIKGSLSRDLIPFQTMGNEDLCIKVSPVINNILVSQVSQGVRNQDGYLLKSNDDSSEQNDFLGDLQGALQLGATGYNTIIQLSSQRLADIGEQFKKYTDFKNLSPDQIQEEQSSLDEFSNVIGFTKYKNTISSTKAESQFLREKDLRKRSPDFFTKHNIPIPSDLIPFVIPVLDAKKKEFYLEQSLNPQAQPINQFGEKDIASEILERLEMIPREISSLYPEITIGLSIRELKFIKLAINSFPEYNGVSDNYNQENALDAITQLEEVLIKLKDEMPLPETRLFMNVGKLITKTFHRGVK